jgi:type IV secretory pathway VirJ component
MIALLAALLAAPPAVPPDSVGDLPLRTLAPATTTDHRFAVLLTGDGGWAPIDRALAAEMNARGIPVVGFESREYFRARRPAAQLPDDLARVLRHFLAVYRADGVLLVGYSRGADALAVMAGGLPPELRAKVRLVAFLGLERKLNLENHLSDFVGGHEEPTTPTRPGVEQLQGLPVVCVHGRDETDTLCPELPPTLARTITTAGGHHFDGDYRAIMRDVLSDAAP